MTIIIAAMQDLLLSFESSKTGWKTHESLKGCHPQSVTFDHRNSNHLYCGTFGDGLWKSDDVPGIVGIELQKTPYPVMTLLQFQLAA